VSHVGYARVEIFKTGRKSPQKNTKTNNTAFQEGLYLNRPNTQNTTIYLSDT
jgi:hypothetical protein